MIPSQISGYEQSPEVSRKVKIADLNNCLDKILVLQNKVSKQNKSITSPLARLEGNFVLP
jgi:hypothetical protein